MTTLDEGLRIPRTTVGLASPEAILGHPRFPAARAVYIDGVMALYEGHPLRLEIMRDGGRIFVYGIIMALWGDYRDDQPETWPTVSRLKQIVERFDVVSPRHVDTIVARFVQAGHLHVVPVADDLRLRLVLPTPGLIEHDRLFLRAHFSPLGVLFGAERYAPALAGDARFLKATRAAWLGMLATMADDVIRRNRPILRFYKASAGFLMLMKLVRLQEQSADGTVALDHGDFARRFGVSRTHVRTLFGAVASDGEIVVDRHGRVRATDELCAALDRNIADRMTLLDRSHAAASAADAART